ncbi:MAG: hypothetical protein KAW12_30285 [Candidatus Aminicenantes bacterium]|nr:hypothetical protein [Candidatus Aminicenantes bacterium]
MASKKENKWLIFTILIFIVTQLLLFFINFDGVSSARKKRLLSGDIFFSGDTFGRFDSAGCDMLGSISRRAALLKKFDDYLYVDFGNFSGDSAIINRAALPLITEAYRAMKLRVMNLTKRDFIALSGQGGDSGELGIDFISANLRIPRPSKNAANLPYRASTFKLLPFKMSSEKETRWIVVGVAGISGDERRLHRGDLDFSVRDIAQSLAGIKKNLEKADLKILLFNESYFKLKRLDLRNQYGL